MLSACFLAFTIGLLSLSQEILWIRLFSFANHSIPQAFSFVLIAFLFGIACGAMLGKKICQGHHHLWIVTGWILLFAALMDVVAPWIYADLYQTNYQVLLGGILIFFTACLKSIIFPIAHHLGTPSDTHQVGKSISKVYVSNIMGATFGPILMSLVFLNYFTTQQCFMFVALGTFFIAILSLKDIILEKKYYFIPFLLLLGIGCYIREPNALIAKIAYTKNLKSVIEDKHSIITIYEGGKEGDIIFGGNVYDGRTNIDPSTSSNGIHRLLVLSVLHEKPTRVLMIGLSIGTWLKLLTSFPGIESMDVVEINPGYLKAIENYPKQKSALSDSRVKLFIDDGRKFLQKNPDNKYDLIVMNTTFHWRAYCTNVLSMNFLNILKNHMNPNAILAYNTTGSNDALKTATHVFSNAYLYDNFIIASDHDWRPALQKPFASKKLASLLLDGNYLFRKDNTAFVEQILNRKIVTLNEFNKKFEPLFKAASYQTFVITDDNLVPEYRHGRALLMN